MSMRSSRTLTLSALAGARRYSSSLSWTAPGVSAANAASAAPNRVPNVRHSQRGMIVAMSRSLGAGADPPRTPRHANAGTSASIIRSGGYRRRA